MPFASLQNSPNPPLQLPGATQAAADLSCSSNKSLKPWQCPFKDVQGCRLPARKTPQTLPLQLPGATQAAADLSCSSNKSLRPWQCPFKDVQGCRLPARKTRQTLPCSSQAPLRPRQTFPAAPTSPWGRGSVFFWTFKAAVCQPAKLCSSQAPLRPRQTFPAAPTSPLRPWQRLFMDVQGCRLPALKTSKPSPAAPRRHSGPRQTFPAAPTSPWGRGRRSF